MDFRWQCGYIGYLLDSRDHLGHMPAVDWMLVSQLLFNVSHDALLPCDKSELYVRGLNATCNLALNTFVRGYCRISFYPAGTRSVLGK